LPGSHFVLCGAVYHDAQSTKGRLVETISEICERNGRHEPNDPQHEAKGRYGNISIAGILITLLVSLQSQPVSGNNGAQVED